MLNVKEEESKKKTVLTLSVPGIQEFSCVYYGGVCSTQMMAHSTLSVTPAVNECFRHPWRAGFLLKYFKRKSPFHAFFE